ncbi:MAG: SAP domain-containing protein, partial [Candidatus Poseidoniales archaeon]|nr:SAP domain-containing protein [Candidatus Poseidoniales archaeon]
MSELSDLTVAQLKELLKEAGLPVSGKKADLIVRLEEAEEHDDDIEEDIVEEDDDFDDFDD